MSGSNVIFGKTDLFLQSAQSSPLRAGCLFATVHQCVECGNVETCGRIAFYVHFNIHRCQFNILFISGLAGQIDDLVEYLTKIIQFIRSPEIILYIDTNNHIGSHSPGYVRGEVVFHPSVNQYLVAHTNGREYAGNSHTGTHSGSQYTIVKHDFFTVHNVLGDTSKRNRQLIEVNGIVIAYSQFGEKITQVLPFNDPSEHIRLQILFQRNRKNISFRILPFSHRLIFPTDTVTQQKRPILVIDHTIKLTGGISDGIKSADDRPHTGTYDIVDRNTCFLNHFEGTDMGYPLRSSPT